MAETRQEAIAELTAPGETYELYEGNVLGRKCLKFKNAPPTLRELYLEAKSEVEFLVYEDTRLTFEDAHIEASKIAHILVERYGIQVGDRVAISMRNYPEWILTFMAVTSIGGVAVAMNSLWKPDEMSYGLTDSGAKLLIADEERIDRFNQIEEKLDIAIISVRAVKEHPYDSLEALLEKATDTDMPEQRPLPESDATILYTSGSTGHPKGVVSCHVNIIHALLGWELEQHCALALLDEPPPDPPDSPATLLAVPLFHATGSHAVYLASYRHQRRIVSMYKWDVREAAEIIENEKITSFIAPAAMTGDLVVEARKTNRDLSSLLSVGGGGAPRAPEQVKSIDESFSNAKPGTGWGMTETNAIGTSIGGDDYVLRPASSGRCSALLELKVINENGDEVATGERGELLIRGTTIFKEYWNRPDANQETFVNGDWMRTGDVAYLDDEGYLFIVDRIKDLVIRGGENIGCGEVEAALLEHPSIQEVSVYAVPDDRLGEEIGATIFAAEIIEQSELNQFLSERIAKFKIPRFLHQEDKPLPRTASGKILKRELRDEAEKRLGLS